MATTHHVVLVPGFLGFGRLGDLRYFVGVGQVLERAFERHHIRVNVSEVPTLPTGSIRQRSARVVEALAKLPDGDEPIHLIGHSTGGLDVRLAVAPTASLPIDPTIDTLALYDRVSTIVSVSTPHYGTPLASFFGSAMGRPFLRILAVAAVFVLRRGHVPLSAALRLGDILARYDNLLGQDQTVLDELYQQLLANFSAERRQQVIDYVEAVSTDQSLIFQLTAAGCDILNAATGDPAGTRYGCVVSQALPPGLRTFLGLGRDLYARPMYGVYAALYGVAARSTETFLPVIAPAEEARLRMLLGDVPSEIANDGIVPTRSQVWGEVIHAVKSDHLDLIGHYTSDREPLSSDWLPSGSGFDRAAFELTWNRVADFIAEPSSSTPTRTNERPPLQPAIDPLTKTKKRR